MTVVSADVETDVLLDSALIGVYNARILIEQGSCVHSWLGPFCIPFLIDSLIECVSMNCLECYFPIVGTYDHCRIIKPSFSIVLRIVFLHH